MPRLSIAVPSYRKHKSGQARVILDGKTFYLGLHGTKASKREYDWIVGEWQANGRSLPVDSKQVISVARLCLEYLRFAKKYYVKNGRITDEVASIKVAIKFLKANYAEIPVTEFGPLSLQAIQEKMIEADHSRNYLNKNVSRIRRIFKWGASRELVPVNIFEALKTVPDLRKGKTKARETKPVLPVSDGIVEETKKYCPDVVSDMIDFQRLVGCRPGELFILRPCDIDQSGDVWRYVPGSHKTEHKGRERVIFIGPKAQDVLRRYLLRADDDVCFRTVRNKRFKKERYSHIIKEACKKAGVERWAPNRLRHNAATEIRSKYGLEGAQVVLGHASADVSQIYAERDYEKASQIARQIG